MTYLEQPLTSELVAEHTGGGAPIALQEADVGTVSLLEEVQAYMKVGDALHRMQQDGRAERAYTVAVARVLTRINTMSSWWEAYVAPKLRGR